MAWVALSEVAYKNLVIRVHIHALFTEKALEREFNTWESLLTHPDVVRFVSWIQNKPDGFRPANQPSSGKRAKQKPNATPW
jgi:hypothetical protein